MMTAATFMFKANFPSLYDNQGSSVFVDTGIAAVTQEWSGCFHSDLTGIPGNGIFRALETGIRNQKQTLLMNYLTGWWLADMYPDKVVGISGDGGMPLTGKSIGGISISRKDLDSQPALKQLESNAFGVKALSLLASAPERFALYGSFHSLNRARGGFRFPGF